MMDFNFSKHILNADDFLKYYEIGIFWKGNIDPAQLTKLFSWETLNHLLSTHRLTNDRLDREHILTEKEYRILTMLSHGSPLSETEIVVHTQNYNFSLESIRGALEKLLEKALVTKAPGRVAV